MPGPRDQCADLARHPRAIAPDRLPGLIRPGSRIFIGSGCSEPVVLTEQLVAQRHCFTDCELVHFLTLSGNRFFDDREPSLFRHHALFTGAAIRDAVNEGKADYIPVSLSDIPRLIRSGRLRIDVALLQVSPPDEFGFCSLGINVDINRTVAEEARTVIAQINPAMPRTMGDSYIRFTDLHHFVVHETPLIEFSYPEPDESVDRIGRHCARLVENGATLQLGIGAIPNAVLNHLRDKKDLAIFSEVLSDSIIDLIDSGVVTCRRNVYPHVMTSFVMGSRRLYDFVDQNPFVEFRPTEFINHVGNIARNTRQVAINAALSVSLTGQVNSDSIGAKIYSGVGGQLDFNRGAAMSDGGKPIVCLPSVTQDGTKSRIVAVLEPGAGVVIPRSDVHWVVTEWGTAYLHGKSIRDRVLQMIGIAHPDFRKGLLEEAKQLRFIYEDQILPQTRDGVVVVYPEQYERRFTTRSLGEILFRPVRPPDERLLQELYYEMDPNDRVMRFFSPRNVFPHRDTQSAVNVDYESCFVLVGITEEEPQAIVAVGSYYLDRNLNLAELAFTVRKEYQRQGLTRHMLERLIEIAREKGIRGFMGEVLRANDPMLRILRSIPYPVHFEADDDTLGFRFLFAERKQDRASAPPPKESPHRG